MVGVRGLGFRGESPPPDTITSGKSGNLTLDATAKTYRYLDQDEIAAQRKAKQQPAKGPAK